MIYIIRHGESEANVKNMFPGLSYPLTKTGKEQVTSSRLEGGFPAWALLQAYSSQFNDRARHSSWLDWWRPHLRGREFGHGLVMVRIHRPGHGGPVLPYDFHRKSVGMALFKAWLARSHPTAKACGISRSPQINSLIPYLQNGSVIYSSPVLRARQSAEILGNALKLKVIVDKRLTEVGSRLDSDVKLKSLEEVKKYTGEPIAAMRRRMSSAINGISADNAIVVSHGHPIAAYLHRVVGSGAKHRTIDSLTPFKGSLSIVETKAPHVILFNWVPYAL